MLGVTDGSPAPPPKDSPKDTILPNLLSLSKLERGAGPAMIEWATGEWMFSSSHRLLGQNTH